MSIEENKQLVIRFNKEFLETGNTEVLKELLADDFTNHTAAAGFAKDVSGIIKFIQLMRTGFPDLTVEIHEQIAERDLVTTRKTLHGTHLGEILEHAPTGKKVAFNVIDIVRIRDGKYVDHWGRNDVMQVIQAL